MNALPIPSAALEADEATELLRLFRADGDLQTLLDIGHWGPDQPDEDARWGKVFGEAILAIAAQLAERDGIPPAQAIRRIKQSFDAEFERPTSSKWIADLDG